METARQFWHSLHEKADDYLGYEGFRFHLRQYALALFMLILVMAGYVGSLVQQKNLASTLPDSVEFDNSTQLQGDGIAGASAKALQGSSNLASLVESTEDLTPDTVSKGIEENDTGGIAKGLEDGNLEQEPGNKFTNATLQEEGQNIDGNEVEDDGEERSESESPVTSAAVGSNATARNRSPLPEPAVASSLGPNKDGKGTRGGDKDDEEENGHVNRTAMKTPFQSDKRTDDEDEDEDKDRDEKQGSGEESQAADSSEDVEADEETSSTKSTTKQLSVTKRKLSSASRKLLQVMVGSFADETSAIQLHAEADSQRLADTLQRQSNWRGRKLNARKLLLLGRSQQGHPSSEIVPWARRQIRSRKMLGFNHNFPTTVWRSSQLDVLSISDSFNTSKAISRRKRLPRVSRKLIPGYNKGHHTREIAALGG